MRNGAIWLMAAIAARPVPVDGAASAIDLHAYWENHCAECHGHAGAFARERLQVHEGRLVSNHRGGALERFLSSHHPRGRSCRS